MRKNIEGPLSESAAAEAIDSARANRLRRRIIAIGVLALLFFTAMAAYDGWRAYERTLDETDRELGNLAFALAAKASSGLRSIDLELQDTAEWYSSAVAAEPGAVNEALERRAVRIPAMLAITDARGRVLFRSRGALPTIADVSDQSFFIAQRDLGAGAASRNERLITRLEQRPVILLSRRLNNPDGGFRGIAFAIVEMEHFQRTYQAIKLPEGSAIVLLRDDGLLLMRQPALRDVVGRTFPELVRPAVAGRGTLGGLDDRPRLIGTSAVSSFPLVVAVTRDKAIALGDWRQFAYGVAIIEATLIALGVLAIGNLLRQVRRIEVSDSALRASEERYALVMKGANEGYWDWNLSGGPSYMSPRNKELYGKGATTPVTSSFEQWQSQIEMHPDDRPAFAAALEAHFSGRSDRYEMEYRVRHPDGLWHWLHVRGWCLRDASGRPQRFIGTSIDITERKNAEAERERLERQLRHAQKLEAMGTLAGGIAHDFNNILGAIVGYGELAQAKTPAGSAEREYLDNVMHAAERAKRLVEQILTFSRSGVAERAAVEVETVVAETLELFAASLRPEIRLKRKLEAPGAAILGDPTQVHQVVMNLCTNAMHAMPDGGVLEVVLRREHLDEDRRLSHGTLVGGDYLRLGVSDVGTGIPASVVDRIFDPFFTTKGVGQGTGLGLSLVHAVVSDLDGAIDVTSAVGKGTTFTIWLPIRAQVSVAERMDAREVPAGHGQTIMVVDDEPALVSLAEETLAELGYEPVGFKSSVAALAAFRATPGRFDAVLTDETMPELTGTDLAHDLRRLRPEIPIVLMSGYAGAQLVKRAATLGVAEILRKPLMRREIAESLERAFAR